MTPAAYHRQAHPEEATEGFIRIASRLALAGLVPLGISVCLELYLVGTAIHQGLAILVASGAIFFLMIFFWFILPRIGKARQK